MVWDRLIQSLLCSTQQMKGRRRKHNHYLWYGKIFYLCSKSKRLWKEKKIRKNITRRTKESQGKFCLQIPNSVTSLPLTPKPSIRQFKVLCLSGIFLLVLKTEFWGRVAVTMHCWRLGSIFSLVQQQMPGCSQWPYAAGSTGKAGRYWAPVAC